MPHKKEVKIGGFLVQESNENLTTPTGLILVGKLIRLSRLQEIVNENKLGKRSKPYIKIGDTLSSYIAMLCQAKTCYDVTIHTVTAPKQHKKTGLSRSIEC